MEKISDSWEQNDDGFFDDEQKMKIIKTIDEESNLNTFDPTTIPFEIIQSSIMAKNSTNETIRVNAVVVTVPFRFYKVGITVMDYLVITSEKIENYIPIGYKKEDPDNFYNIVSNHSLWINKTRHAIIKNVPTIKHMRGEINSEGYTLEKMLKKTPGVDNVSYNASRKQITIAIPTHKLAQVTRTIQGAITSGEFTYKPQLAKNFNPTGSLGSISSGTSKYSAAMKKHQVDISPNSSVATSNDGTKMTGNTGWSWTTQKKIPKEIDFTDATEFPSLTSATRNQTTTANDESITNTTVIQQAIDTALKKAYDDHRKELEAMQEAMQAKFNKQLQLIQQQNNTTSLEKKFDSLLELLLKDNPTIERESPIRKKGKPTNLEETTFSQIDTPPRSNINHQQEPPSHNMEIDDEPPMGPHFDNELPMEPQFDSNHVDNGIIDARSSNEEDWIIKEKKEKKPHRMTQAKLVDMMKNGGYGTIDGRGSPSRNAGRGTPPRNKQTIRSQESNVVLTPLSSPRRGHNEPRGREH